MVENSDEILSIKNRIDLLKAEIDRRKVCYNIEIYKCLNSELYEKVKSESYRELKNTEHFLKFLPSLRNIERLSNIEVNM